MDEDVKRFKHIIYVMDAGLERFGVDSVSKRAEITGQMAAWLSFQTPERLGELSALAAKEASE